MGRQYSMRARAAQLQARRDAILDAAYDLFSVVPFDEVSLAEVARCARVGTKTILRRFGSKDALLAACIQWGSRRETSIRAVPAGDVPAVVSTLAARYEAGMDAMRRYIELEDRVPVVERGLRAARVAHRDWLAAAFDRWLPARGVTRTRRLAALFGTTEIYVWWSWRRRLGLSRADAEAAMLQTLEAVVDRWRKDR
jgi:AcrR family transcriptional regulator